MNTESLSSSEPRRGLAIASLVLGIVGLCLSLFLVGAVLGVLGLVLGVAHILGKRGRNGMAWWGVSLSVLSILAAVALSFAYFATSEMKRRKIIPSAFPTIQTTLLISRPELHPWPPWRRGI